MSDTYEERLANLEAEAARLEANYNTISKRIEDLKLKRNKAQIVKIVDYYAIDRYVVDEATFLEHLKTKLGAPRAEEVNKHWLPSANGSQPVGTIVCQLGAINSRQKPLALVEIPGPIYTVVDVEGLEVLHD